jgi:hypothetical protein
LIDMSTKDRLRLRIAQEAARIMAEEGVHDYLPAKQKAAARLGIAASGNLPRNEDIDAALNEYHRLYRAHVQPQHIVRLRTLALEAMRFLREFSPRLVGSVLEGSAGEFSPITLHLFPEAPEDVIRKLMDGKIPFSEKSALLPTGSGRTTAYPALCFLVDGVEVHLVLVPIGLRQQRMARKDRSQAKGDENDVAELIRQCRAPISSIA